MKKVNPARWALFLGSVFAFAHLVWSVVISLGLAQWYLDWILGLHSLNNPFHVMAFDLTRSVTLIVVTFVFGFVFGWVIGTLWNMLHTK